MVYDGHTQVWNETVIGDLFGTRHSKCRSYNCTGNVCSTILPLGSLGVGVANLDVKLSRDGRQALRADYGPGRRVPHSGAFEDHRNSLSEADTHRRQPVPLLASAKFV